MTPTRTIVEGKSQELLHYLITHVYDAYAHDTSSDLPLSFVLKPNALGSALQKDGPSTTTVGSKSEHNIVRWRNYDVRMSKCCVKTI